MTLQILWSSKYKRRHIYFFSIEDNNGSEVGLHAWNDRFMIYEWRVIRLFLFANYFSYFILYTSSQGSTEHRHLCWADIRLKSDCQRGEYLELNERQTKTRQGTDITNVRKVAPKIFENSDKSRYFMWLLCDIFWGNFTIVLYCLWK